MPRQTARLSMSGSLDPLSLGQAPRLAFRPVEPPVGLRIADDLLFVRIPLQRPVEPVGDVSQVAHGRGPAGDLDIPERQLPRAHAMDEIAKDAAVALVIGN